MLGPPPRSRAGAADFLQDRDLAWVRSGRRTHRLSRMLNLLLPGRPTVDSPAGADLVLDEAMPQRNTTPARDQIA